jgi:hypothetical protein
LRPRIETEAEDQSDVEEVNHGYTQESQTLCSTHHRRGIVHPGNGTTFEVRDRSYATVWDAAVRTLERRSLVIVVADREAGVLRAENRMDWFSWGQVVGVFIRPTRPDAERYLVEVQSLKRARYAFTGSDWTQSVITGMQADLGDKIPAQVQK